MPVSSTQPQRVAPEWEKHIFDKRRERLAELEAVIGPGLKSFVEVGLALKEIRDRRLYRELVPQHATFEDYCQERWGMGRRYANRTIEAAEVAGVLGPIGPTNEAQARELAPLSTERRREVWAMVTSPGSPPPTAKRIREVIRETRERPERDNADPQAEAEGIKYRLRVTVILTPDTDIVTPDTDTREFEELIRTGQVHLVLRNGRNKTIAVAWTETVESLERLPALEGIGP